jgi:hypothetical protein
LSSFGVTPSNDETGVTLLKKRSLTHSYLKHKAMLMKPRNVTCAAFTQVNPRKDSSKLRQSMQLSSKSPVLESHTARIDVDCHANKTQEELYQDYLVNLDDRFNLIRNKQHKRSRGDCKRWTMREEFFLVVGEAKIQRLGMHGSCKWAEIKKAFSSELNRVPENQFYKKLYHLKSKKLEVYKM